MVHGRAAATADRHWLWQREAMAQHGRRSRRRQRQTAAHPFDLVYGDPPLHFRLYSPKRQNRGPEYETLPVPTICRLPVKDIVAPNAALIIWPYDPLLFETDKIAAAWEFLDYGGVLFTWVKLTKHGKPWFGQGYSTRKASEQCLLFTRRSGLPRRDKGVRQVIEAEVGEPHEKPEEAARRIERLYGDWVEENGVRRPLRRLELYARRERPGWICWGNQVGLLPASPA
jgi:N6-adenosine-specific RNA methylase IME4